MRVLPLGLVVGTLSGLLGIGGGVLAVVGLVALGYGQHAAHATSLAAIILTAAAAVVPFAAEGAVAVHAALALAAGAVIGAAAGAGAMRHVPERGLRAVFALLLVATALRMAFGTEAPAGAGVPDLGAVDLFLCGLLGVATGALSSVLGVGGGVVMVPALVLAFGFPQHAAEGTSLAVIIPTALVGASRHHASGFTDWRTGAWLGVAGISGGLLGATVALRLEALVLQRLFAVLLVVMTVRLLIPARNHRPQVDA